MTGQPKGNIGNAPYCNTLLACTATGSDEHLRPHLYTLCNEHASYDIEVVRCFLYYPFSRRFVFARVTSRANGNGIGNANATSTTHVRSYVVRFSRIPSVHCVSGPRAKSRVDLYVASFLPTNLCTYVANLLKGSWRPRNEKHSRHCRVAMLALFS